MRRHLHGVLIVFLVVTVSANNALHRSINEVQTMTSKHEQAVQLLRLPDADYFSFNQARQVKLQSELARLANNDDSESKPLELILALGSPTAIDVTQHGSIPV